MVKHEWLDKATSATHGVGVVSGFQDGASVSTYAHEGEPRTQKMERCPSGCRTIYWRQGELVYCHWDLGAFHKNLSGSPEGLRITDQRIDQQTYALYPSKMEECG